MSDRFRLIPMESLVDWVFSELEVDDSILGVPRSLFFTPQASDPFALRLYGRRLETPVGVAAGPHTQLAQNIVLAWLCGARVIELKTVQVLDELDIPKPCIQMPDEGYNVEWSQELAIDESIDEYVRAWVLIHSLHHLLGFPGQPGVLFNLSVGYDLAGVKSDKVRRFVSSMMNAEKLVARHRETLLERRPDLSDLEIPNQLSDSVTLSTMHGCPPDEIGRISTFLMDEWGLHTSVKLNPTLLGPEELDHVLHDRLGWHHLEVPAQAFEHDIEMDDAVSLIQDLERHAQSREVDFGVKLTNTLEVVNHGVFSASEEAMYLSGRPLHAVTVHVAHRLTETFAGGLLMSFSGGADAFNLAPLLAGGLSTVTTCSDLLRPGGYSRLLQYIDNIRGAMDAVDADNLEAFIVAADMAARDASVKIGEPSLAEIRIAARRNLARYTSDTLENQQLECEHFYRRHTKTSRQLGLFDCIEAPCTDACDTDQDVPAYLRAVQSGKLDDAVEITRRDNALPSALGHACTHPCEPVCLRTHYDEPLAIREIKRFIMEHEASIQDGRAPTPQTTVDKPVAIIGGGPCGLSAATFLARAGFPVTVFESHPYSGGMVAGTIPVYRTSHEVFRRDLEAVTKLGVEIRHDVTVGSDQGLAELFDQGFRSVVIAAGAQQSIPLGIPGESGDGIVNGLAFLRQAKHDTAPTVGRRVLVIGGGDVAMDCARTARRLTGGEVKVLYRRTRAEMPASLEEVEDLLEEGAALIELVTPTEVLRDADGSFQGLRCVRMELGEPDASGRRRPLPVEGSEHDLKADTVLLAIGQRPRLGFLAEHGVELDRRGFVVVDPETLETSVRGIFAGGDAVPDGAQTIVRACGDGRRIAAEIVARETGSRTTPEPFPPVDREDLVRRRALRQWRVEVPRLPAADRTGFDEVIQTLSDEAAQEEAGRCLDCDQMCSTCEGVCPNHAIFTYHSQPSEIGPVALRQTLQVAVLADFCNECGNCVTFCPTSGEPFRDKPRLYLHRPDFEAQDDNAFMLLRGDQAWAIEGRFGGALHRLDDNGQLSYSGAGITLTLNPESLEIEGAPPGCELEACATLATLLRALQSSAPGLPTSGIT